LPSNLTNIVDGAFSGCVGLTSITLPSNIIGIGPNTFNGCTGLTSVSLPPNLTSIGNSAFSGCTGLTSITLPSNVSSIDVLAFGDCTNLADITLSSAVPPGTDSSSFRYVSPGAVVHVPGGSGSTYRAVNDMNQGDNKWYGLYIDDPDMAPSLSGGTVIRISDAEAFVNFNMDLDAAYYYVIVNDGDTPPVIDTTGPGEAGSAPGIGINFTTLTAGAKDLYVVAKRNGNLSNTLKIDIHAYAPPFDVVISNHEAGMLSQEVDAYLDNHGFSGAYESMHSLKVTGGILNFTDMFFLSSIGQTWYSMESIDYSGTAFENNIVYEGLFTYLGSCVTVKLPEGVTAISDYAFEYCSNLKNITIPSSITSIGDYAFSECASLETIIIPSGVTSIGADAFSDCTALSDITMNSSIPPSVGNYAFDGISSGAVVHVPHGSGAVYQAAQDGNTSDSLWYGLSIQEASDTSGGGNSSGGSGGGTTAAPQNNETAVSGSIAVTTASTAATSDNNGNASASFTASQAEDAVRKAAAAAAKEGGDTAAQVRFEVTAPADASSVKTTLPVSAIDLASENKISSLTVSTPIASVTFDRNAVLALSSQTSGDVSITASRVDSENLSDELQRAVGDHPVYDFSVTAGGQSVTKFGGNVTVTVPYTLKTGEDANSIIIYYINSDGNAEAVANSVYDPATGTISFTTNHFSRYAVGYHEVSFNDVAENAWYRDAVTFASARGITSGTGGGNFSPGMILTRGQFLVMAMRAYGLSPDQNPADNFADAGNTYYAGYLAAAKRLGISAGVGGNLFQPDSNITRQEVFTLLHNMLSALNRLPDGSVQKTSANFEDGNKIASWAKDAMALFIEAGVIKGSGGKLNADGESSRAEMVQILYNLLSSKK